ncbi:hypothetical protein AOZ07_16380 [Glutamicibacter halophytocola]|nr:hypothetical protein AOZ07_16380 [Glutamicibacter halophytocola]
MIFGPGSHTQGGELGCATEPGELGTIPNLVLSASTLPLMMALRIQRGILSARQATGRAWSASG